MPVKDISTLPAHEQVFQRHRQEFQDYLPLVEQAECELQDDVEELQAQEGWDMETREGVAEWVKDRDSIWRALRRNRYDPDKAHAFLLSALTHRLALNLHRPIPSSLPYAQSPLFFFLPLPRFTDRLGRPVAVLTLREVVRDESGGLDDMKEWVWWALEMVRRILRDWWRGSAWGSGGHRRKCRGYGGEGCLLLIDAEGAGYRNMEVELLPTLFSVGHNNFPGIFEAVFVVNAGWSHRVMWNSVVKRVLPRSALEKVAFLESKNDLATVFDLDHWPKAYGGTEPYVFKADHNPVLHRYSNLPASAAPSRQPSRHPSRRPSRQPSRVPSAVSIADIYYTAHNSPSSSRAITRSQSFVNGHNLANGLGIHGLGSRLAMTRSREATGLVPLPPPSRPAPTATMGLGGSGPDAAGLEMVNEKLAQVSPSDRSPFDEEFGQATNSSHRGSGRVDNRDQPESSGPASPIQRIKSLSNFHLYLSPSRLAHRDLLSDSEDEEPVTAQNARAAFISALFKKRASGRPNPCSEGDGEGEAGNGEGRQTVAERRSRPELRLHIPTSKQEDGPSARTYSHQLQEHHAKGLEMYAHVPDPRTSSSLPRLAESVTPRALDTSVTPHAEPNQSALAVAEDDQGCDETGTGTGVETTGGALIPLYSSANPWFGYPAVLVPDPFPGGRGYAIRPRYARNRKRDLVKTLLFLFTLRLQAWRDTFERALGLNRLGRGGGGGDSERGREWEKEARNPAEGLGGESGGSREGRDGTGMGRGRGKGRGRGEMGKYGYGSGVNRYSKEGEWVWMVVGFLVLRGTWTRLVGGLLEAVGMESVRVVLGI